MLRSRDLPNTADKICLQVCDLSYINLLAPPQFIGFLLINSNLFLYQPVHTNYVNSIISFIENVQEPKVLRTSRKASWSNR